MNSDVTRALNRITQAGLAGDAMFLHDLIVDLERDARRWRVLEHGCQWVSWTPTGGETRSFDPRHIKRLQDMREYADRVLGDQLRTLRIGINELEARWRRG